MRATSPSANSNASSTAGAAPQQRSTAKPSSHAALSTNAASKTYADGPYSTDNDEPNGYGVNSAAAPVSGKKRRSSLGPGASGTSNTTPLRKAAAAAPDDEEDGMDIDSAAEQQQPSSADAGDDDAHADAEEAGDSVGELQAPVLPKTPSMLQRVIGFLSPSRPGQRQQSDGPAFVSPSRSQPAAKPAAPQSASAASVRSSFNATRRAPRKLPSPPRGSYPMGGASSTASSAADRLVVLSPSGVAGAGAGGGVRMRRNSMKGSNGAAAAADSGSSSSSSSASGSSGVTAGHSRPMLPQRPIIKATRKSRSAVVRERLYRAVLFGLAVALGLHVLAGLADKGYASSPSLSSVPGYGRVFGSSASSSSSSSSTTLVCMPTDALLEPTCLGLCLSSPAACATLACDRSTRTIGYSKDAFPHFHQQDLDAEAEDDARGVVLASSTKSALSRVVDPGAVPSTHCDVTHRVGLHGDLGVVMRLTLLLPAEVLRFLLSVVQPVTAAKTGLLVELGFLAGALLSFMLE